MFFVPALHPPPHTHFYPVLKKLKNLSKTKVGGSGPPHSPPWLRHCDQCNKWRCDALGRLKTTRGHCLRGHEVKVLQDGQEVQVRCKFKRVVLTPRGHFRPFCKRVVLTLRKGRFNSEGSFDPIKGSK